MTSSIPESAEDAGPKEYPPRILFYDGVCGLCNKLVQVVIDADRERVFRYAPLQGDTAAALRQVYPEIPDDLDTMVYVEDGRVYTRAHAVMQAASRLSFPFRVLSWFRWVPAVLANPFYNLVARVRYRLFGKYDQCRLPSPQERQLFLA